MELMSNILGGVVVALVLSMFVGVLIAVAMVKPLALYVFLGVVVIGAIGGSIFHWKNNQ